MYKGTQSEAFKGLKTETSPLIIDLKQEILGSWLRAVGQVKIYKKYVLSGSDSYSIDVKTAIYGLYLVIRSSLRAEFEGLPEFKQMTKDFNDTKTKIEIYLEHYFFMDGVLYDKGLTKFDGKQRYDRSNAEASNIHKGY